jgi:hypothetical protein
VKYEHFAASKLELLLYKAIAEKRANVAESLAVGSVKSYEEYKYWTGYIAALKDFNDMIVTARKQLAK